MLIYSGSMTMGSLSILVGGLGRLVGREVRVEARHFHRFRFQRGAGVIQKKVCDGFQNPDKLEMS